MLANASPSIGAGYAALSTRHWCTLANSHYESKLFQIKKPPVRRLFYNLKYSIS